jgi:hypothetical protein
MQPNETKKLDDVQTDLENLWFDAPPVSVVRRTSSLPPPSAVEKVGEFLGDPDVDAWLR